MDKIKIKIIKLGKQSHEYLFKRLEKYNSKIFKCEIYKMNRPKCDYEWGYKFETLEKLLSEKSEKNKFDMCIGFVDTVIEKNYFGKRLDKDNNIYVISFYEIDCILKDKHIDLFNYMITTMYRYITRYKLQITGNDLVHDETRGCIFDMCGDKRDVVYFCQKPIICDECRNKINNHVHSEKYMIMLDRELASIKPILFDRIINFIKSHSKISLVIGIISTIILDLISSKIYDVFFNHK
ncbi:hypothetical protein GTH52_01995 [Clostridium tyrobutyricum]|jgi:hypothetical protein|uniref:Uncharacterized protein n=1 Tax=Clostridium tyrobutyricum DIVETGP TaxID=1408889 RepID=W6N890_CLOTY|nr:hypothetical protein [Clostridium tyrobutyricum]AND85376.1 hypothetical protein CTK_C21280 [Clostridium tyrobutyricum]ANP69924.1 hypothetical protein BA182_09605 [Clostridium tyrobutyricum]MBV4424156.1 hypothetical protein [Clostridium tyrobutyricum]MBV4433978.1 hypothetical protein [Clostridium tyrobutyricum]QNB65714.1 hypothetical protein GTH52_01995 [Clostridium tyrobutyricum]